MKIVTANGKKKLVISKSEWESIGKKTGWEQIDNIRCAQHFDVNIYDTEYIYHTALALAIEVYPLWKKYDKNGIWYQWASGNKSINATAAARAATAGRVEARLVTDDSNFSTRWAAHAARYAAHAAFYVADSFTTFRRGWVDGSRSAYEKIKGAADDAAGAAKAAGIAYGDQNTTKDKPSSLTEENNNSEQKKPQTGDRK